MPGSRKMGSSFLEEVCSFGKVWNLVLNG